MITKIWCGRAGQMAYEFDNGNIVSIVWSWGTYSDNHMDKLGEYDLKEIIHRQNWESTTVEVYSMGEDTNGFTKYLEHKYGQNPAAYVPVNDIRAILARADRKP